MSSSTSYRPGWRRAAETVLIAAAGGAALGLSGVPAGWMSGAIIAVTTAALAGRPVWVPDILGRFLFVVLGISLGAGAKPSMLGLMALWPISLAALMVTMTVVTGSVAWYLRWIHGWEICSAIFAAAPGALAQALALALDAGADVRAIAMVQAVRVLVLSVGLPVGLAAFGMAGVPALVRPAVGSIGELAGLIALSSLVAVIAYRCRIPGGLILGAMASSGLLHGCGIVTGGLPPAVTTATSVLLGAIVGARFAGVDIRLLRGLALVGLGALGVAILVVLVFAVAIAHLLSLPLGDVIIAFAPGALEAMSILAFALHLDPAYVGTHHIVRYLFVSALIPLLIRRIRRSATAIKPPVSTMDGQRERGSGSG
jgi:uncharacterized protein